MKIERLTPALYQDIKMLVKICFKKRVTSKSIERRFVDAIGFVAYIDNKPVAYYGVFPQTVQGYKAAQSGWTMTHPDHRGKGLFKALARKTYQVCQERGYDFVFGFPNRNSYPGFCSLGWEWEGVMQEIHIRGYIPFTELLHRFRMTSWILSKRERTYNGIPYRIDGHIYIGDYRADYLGCMKILRRHCSGKLIMTYHVKKDYTLWSNNLPVGFYKINKNIDYAKITFNRRDFDTYFS